MFKYLYTIVNMLLSLVLMLACSASENVVQTPPASLRLSRFYKKYCNANGLAIVASSKVSDAAMIVARDTVSKMLWGRVDILRQLQKNGVRVAVMALTEMTTDIPEHSDLYRFFPQTDWNQRCRGVGATMQRPVCSCAEKFIAVS